METLQRVTTGQTLHQRTELVAGMYQWYLEPGSHLYLIHEQYSCEQMPIHITFHLSVSSTLTYVPIITDARTIHITVQLADDASAEVRGAYAFNGTQKSSLITRQEHTGKRTASIVQINGIATDASALEYRGMIAIQEQAGKSRAHQENKTLLLSTTASALSIPSLEVLTNDVQCGHGSAVGPLPKEQLMYAQSRGISLPHAQRLLITSYFAQALSAILDDTVRHEIVARLVAKALGE